MVWTAEVFKFDIATNLTDDVIGVCFYHIMDLAALHVQQLAFR